MEKMTFVVDGWEMGRKDARRKEKRESCVSMFSER
jgi:hypothetical protein